MAFVDHDFHIHSYLSPGSGAEGVTQTAENILKYAEENGFNTICVTDHYWDETVPSRVGMWRRENTAWIRSILPLPQSERVRFLFGCEADMDIDDVIGVAPEHYADFDFVIIPTNHLHLSGQTCRGDEGKSIEKELKAKGLIKHLGFSFHSTAEELEEILKAHPEAEFVQLQLNYADWESPSIQSRKIYEVARKYNRKFPYSVENDYDVYRIAMQLCSIKMW